VQSKRPLSACELRARRRNARRSTGPRTKEGRRRSSLNWRRPVIPRGTYETLAKLQATPEGFIRTWRDLHSIFWFLGPEFDPYIDFVAWDWWLKEYHADRSAPERTLRLIDTRIENALGYLIDSCGMINRKWRVQFGREIGSTGEAGLWELRLAIEARLPAYRRLSAEGKLPEIPPLKATMNELEQVLQELERNFERIAPF